MPVWLLILLGIGGETAEVSAGSIIVGATVRSVATNTIRTQGAKMVVQQGSKTMIAKTVEQGAVNSIFQVGAQTQNVGKVATFSQQAVQQGTRAVNNYAKFSKITGTMSKMRNFNIGPRL